MKPTVLIAGGCVALLGGALALSHVISTPDPVTYELPPATTPVAEPTLVPPPAAGPRVLRAPAPGETYTQRPEFDAADEVLASPNASNDSVRDAAGLFSRCVQYEPANTRCVESLARAQARVAALPPDPITPPVALQDTKVRGLGEPFKKRELTKFRTLPVLKGSQFDRTRIKPVEAAE